VFPADSQHAVRHIRSRAPLAHELGHSRLGCDVLTQTCRHTQSDIPAFIYYRSRANWAELSVWDSDRYIVWEGEINAKCKSGEFEMQYTLSEQMEMLEHYWL
jgi:hypothetical protein